MRKQIAVVSRREALLRFFAIEAERLGLECRCDSRFEADMRGCDLLVLDEETVQMTDRVSGILLLISSHYEPTLIKEEGGTVYRLSWPISAREMNHFLLSCVIDGNENVRSLTAGTNGARESSAREAVFLGADHARYRGQYIPLSATESKVLLVLARARGELVTRQELSSLLGSDKGNMADVYVCHLRNKLEKPFATRLIETVRGKGYRLCADVILSDESAWEDGL